jgi:drug/metabolite transporter superfamily protein YnfA
MAEGFELVQEEKTARVVTHPRTQRDTEGEIAKQFLGLLLTTVSQRAVAAFSALFTVIGLATCFWLWLAILSNPTPSQWQLVGATIYSGFVILLEIVRRRNRSE